MTNAPGSVDVGNNYREGQNEAASPIGSYDPVIETKQWRVDLDSILQQVKSTGRTSRERSITITKLQEAIMWLGMDLKALNEPNPYPNSYNTSNRIIESAAQGLKL